MLYQCSTGAPIADVLADRDGPLIVDYHNITPARLFEAWEPRIARELDDGTSASRAARRACGARHRRLGVQPGRARSDGLPGDRGRSGARRRRRRSTARSIAARSTRLTATKRGSEWLFVGRVAPNKAQHDVLRAFALYRRCYDPHAHAVARRGVVVAALLACAAARPSMRLGLATPCGMPGSVSDSVLAAHYRAADVFVCLSDHEGFCVPLLEAMHHRVPIVAFAPSAVPETLGDAGLCLPDKAPAAVAEAVSVVLSDPALRAQLTAAERGSPSRLRPRAHERDLHGSRSRSVVGVAA